MAVVVISRLADEVAALIPEPLLTKTNRGYTCFHYRPTPVAEYEPAFARGVYDRGRLRYKSAEITTVFGLPEFDTPGFGTQLAIQLLPHCRGNVVVLNPGQGLLPAAAGRALALDDRDLLAIRNTSRNATVTGEAAGTAVAMLREREPLAVTLANLAGYSRMLVAGTSTQITRLLDALGGEVVERRKNRGFSAAVVERRVT
jgi:hypothetical protein